MPKLQDLFVSYKAIQPDEPTTDRDEMQEMIETRLAARSRAQQIAAMQDEEEQEPEQPVEETVEDWQSDLNDQPDEFKWFTTQLRAAWQKSPIPEANRPQNTPSFQFTGTVTKYNRGRLDEEIKELFARNGINIVVTSGKRKAGAAGKAGAKSYHVGGNAVDITPGSGETFESIRKKMSSNPEILQFFYENGLGVIDETTAANMKKTGATGKHYHIGPDKWALSTWSGWTRNVPAGYSASLNYVLRGDTISKAAEFISREENGTSFNSPLTSQMLNGYTLKGESNKTYGYGLMFNPEHPGKTMAQVKSTYTQPELQRLAKKTIENNLKTIDSYGLNLTENQRIAMAHRYHFGPKVGQEFMEYMKKNGVPTAQEYFDWWHKRCSKMKNADKYLKGWDNGLRREMQLWNS